MASTIGSGGFHGVSVSGPQGARRLTSAGAGGAAARIGEWSAARAAAARHRRADRVAPRPEGGRRTLRARDVTTVLSAASLGDFSLDARTRATCAPCSCRSSRCRTSSMPTERVNTMLLARNSDGRDGAGCAASDCVRRARDARRRRHHRDGRRPGPRGRRRFNRRRARGSGAGCRSAGHRAAGTAAAARSSPISRTAAHRRSRSAVFARLCARPANDCTAPADSLPDPIVLNEWAASDLRATSATR